MAGRSRRCAASSSSSTALREMRRRRRGGSSLYPESVISGNLLAASHVHTLICAAVHGEWARRLGGSLMDPLTLRRSCFKPLFSLNVALVGPGRGVRTCDLMLGLCVSVAAFRSACSCLMLRRLPLHIQLELLEHAATWMINQSRSFSCSGQSSACSGN